MKFNFIQKRLKGCVYACRGAYLLLKTEPSIQVQAGLAVIMTIAGFYFQISKTEWMLQCFAIGIVLSLEGANTAIEEIADFVHPDFHHKIGLIKDFAAGAVFFAALTAIIIGVIIYVPYLMN